MIPEASDGPSTASFAPTEPVDYGVAVLAAVLSSDPRPSLVFNAAGEMILANPAAATSLLAEWHDFPRSYGWDNFTQQAQRDGAVRVRLLSGSAGELNHLSLEGRGRTDVYLLRFEEPGAQSALALRSERLTSMAHDLRVPLQSLIIATDSLAKRAESAPELAEISALAGLALERVRSLLETSRQEETAQGGEPVEVFDLVGLLRNMAILLSPISVLNGNQIKVEAPMGEAWHSGPAHLIRTVLQNLVSNADRFTKAGTITLRLRLGEANRYHYRVVTIEVEDDGPGMSAAERDQLGSAIRAEGNAISQDGYGLGLGIVTRAVSGLRGQIHVKPGAASGTCFAIEFPLAVAAEMGASAPVTVAHRLDNASILVVEDNQVNLAILLRMLSDAGADVAGVASGGAALQHMDEVETAPDLILMDVSLPDIDGIEVTRRLRARVTEGPRPIIIGLTAHDGSIVHGSCLAAGMNRVLVKPVSPSELRQALHDALTGTAANARVKKKLPVAEVLDAAMVAELTEELGGNAVLSFMRKALAEAGTVLEAYRAQMPSAELRALIHSSIGSAGLTGLSGVLKALRELQEDARAGTTNLQHEDGLQNALQTAHSALEAMAVTA